MTHPSMFHNSRCLQLFLDLLQILWLSFLCYLPLLSNAETLLVFLLLAHCLVCASCSFPRIGSQKLAYLLRFCLECYQGLFHERGERDLRTADYRNDDKRKGYSILQHIIQKTFGGFSWVFRSQTERRIHPYRASLSIPSILRHYKRLWTFLYLLSPRIYQYLFALYCSYLSASCALRSFPWALARRRGFVMG